MQIFHLIKRLYTWLLPYTCILCRHPSERNQDLCEFCYQHMPILTHTCHQCARELPPGEMFHSICGQCISHSPPFNVTYALFSYENPVKKLLLNLKFNKYLAQARIFGELLAHKIRTTWYRGLSYPEIILPVPIHPNRLKERGFNQALEIARPIKKLLKIPIDTHSCKRIRYTKAQATLPAKMRKNNIKNAFFVERKLTHQHIAILDDVITTGQTITEFAKTLKKAGASRVDVWCCARAQVYRIEECE